MDCQLGPGCYASLSEAPRSFYRGPINSKTHAFSPPLLTVIFWPSMRKLYGNTRLSYYTLLRASGYANYRWVDSLSNLATVGDAQFQLDPITSCRPQYSGQRCLGLLRGPLSKLHMLHASCKPSTGSLERRPGRQVRNVTRTSLCKTFTTSNNLTGHVVTCPSSTMSLNSGPGSLSLRNVNRCMRSFSASSSRVWIQPWSLFMERRERM